MGSVGLRIGTRSFVENTECQINVTPQILFYEDPVPLRELAAKFPAYAEKFPQWSEHTSGMHQYICMLCITPFASSRC